MELKEAIKILKGCEVIEVMPDYDDIDYSNYNQAIRVVLEALENSIPKKKIEDKVKEKELILQTGNAETSDDKIHLEGEIFSLQNLLEDK